MMATLSTIHTVWNVIEQFLLLEDTVHASQTCQLLNQTIVDAETRRTKVSHLEVISATLLINDHLARFLPRALSEVHFPSLAIT